MYYNSVIKVFKLIALKNGTYKYESIVFNSSTWLLYYTSWVFRVRVIWYHNKSHDTVFVFIIERQKTRGRISARLNPLERSLAPKQAFQRVGRITRSQKRQCPLTTVLILSSAKLGTTVVALKRVNKIINCYIIYQNQLILFLSIDLFTPSNLWKPKLFNWYNLFQKKLQGLFLRFSYQAEIILRNTLMGAPTP